MAIREAGPADLEDVLSVEREAFAEEEEAELVAALLDDPSARPTVSLLAFRGQEPVGHVLFTAARIVRAEGGIATQAAILAPLAVVPHAQNQGVGAALIAAGIERVRELGIGIAIVLGHPGYYPRSGFVPAAPLGITAPYPIDPPEAFMVLETVAGALEGVSGVLEPCEALMRPEYWRE